MRLLFVKEHLAWPRSSGHDVHCFHMMQALVGLGHQVSLATLNEPTAEAVRGLDLASTYTLAAGVGHGSAAPEPVLLEGFQERFRSYWGIDAGRIRAVGAAAEDFGADAVVVVGLNVLPYLGAVRRPLRVWYAADEWAWHHLSQVRLLTRSTWGEVKQAMIKGLYERAYGPLLDRVWMVSEADRRAMAWVAGVRDQDVIPNGVDAGHYHPGNEPQRLNSCVFWGRLDFGPNIQALQWFCGRVWPTLRRAVPDARFTIYGFQPTAPVQALVRADQGVEVVPDRPDIRSDVRGHQVVVLPFVSGGGIKNKLLEAASLGKAIVCTPRTCGGLRDKNVAPVLLAASVPEWVRALTGMWADAEQRRRLGDRARDWVITHHTWQAAAQTAVAALESHLREKARQ